MKENLAEILASNLDYLKVNNIEKAIGLKKTALVRMIARKEIPDKHKDAIIKWWSKWVTSLIIPVIAGNNQPENKRRIEEERKGFPNTDNLKKPLSASEAFGNDDIQKQIASLEAEYKIIPDSGLGKKLRLSIQNKIYKLKHGI